MQVKLNCISSHYYHVVDEQMSGVVKRLCSPKTDSHLNTLTITVMPTDANKGNLKQTFNCRAAALHWAF